VPDAGTRSIRSDDCRPLKRSVQRAGGANFPQGPRRQRRPTTVKRIRELWNAPINPRVVGWIVLVFAVVLYIALGT
jgi:hypothetical protein